MIELYHGDCRAFLSHYNGPAFDAVITDPPYSSGGATLSERSASTAEKYTNTKRNCPFPDFAGDQMDARSWLHMMADVFADARVHCHDGAVLVAFCDWRQMPLLTDAVQWAGWQWRGTLVWDKLTSRPQKGRFRQQAELRSGRATENCRLIALCRCCRGCLRRRTCRGCSASTKRRSRRRSCGRYAKSVCRAVGFLTRSPEAVRHWRRRSWKGTIRLARSCLRKLQRGRRKGSAWK